MGKLYSIFFFIGMSFFSNIQSQSILASDVELLKKKQDSLSAIGINMVESIEAGDRFRADSLFTRLLVRSLKTPNSFYFSFDSIQTISKIYAPDSSFRIFTWQVSKDENTHRRHGAIQMRTNNGNLKLYPLVDRSFIIENQQDTITNNEWWIGSIYYKIIKKEFQGKPFYTLLGYDENSIRSTKKRVEVLQFNESGTPVFGGNYFNFQKDSIPRKNQARFWIEYKKNANARILFDEELDMIIFDNLISESNEPLKKFTLIPDGDYQGFKWINGQWQHINKVFTFKLEDGQAPVEKPILSNQLNPTKKGV